MYVSVYGFSMATPIQKSKFNHKPDTFPDANDFNLVWLKNISRTVKKISKHHSLNLLEFIDVGCGTGISTLYAHKFRFRRIWGFDFQPSFIDQANANRIRRSKYAEVEFHVGDATSICFQDSEPKVLFLFNPFGSTTLRKFLENNHDKLLIGRSFLIVIYDPDLIEELYITPNLHLMTESARYNYSIWRYGK